MHGLKTNGTAHGAQVPAALIMRRLFRPEDVSPDHAYRAGWWDLFISAPGTDLMEVRAWGLGSARVQRGRPCTPSWLSKGALSVPLCPELPAVWGAQPAPLCSMPTVRGVHEECSSADAACTRPQLLFPTGALLHICTELQVDPDNVVSKCAAVALGDEKQLGGGCAGVVRAGVYKWVNDKCRYRCLHTRCACPSVSWRQCGCIPSRCACCRATPPPTCT